LEYKCDLDGLARDFDKQLNSSKHIGLAILWKVSGEAMSRTELRWLLIGRSGEVRQHYGATHLAYLTGSEEPAFEVIVLEDLVRFLADRNDEVARQKALPGRGL